MTFFTFMKIFISPFVRFLFPVKIIGKENLITDKRALIICNHYSGMDTTVLVGRIFKKELNVITKVEAFESKIGNAFLKHIGCIPIVRGEPDMSAHKKILSVLKNDKQLMMFPEGTRNKELSKKLLPFKTGAAVYAIKTKAPVVPMIYYRKTGVFKKTYLVIGKPISLEKYYDKNVNNIKDEATDLIYNKMLNLRIKTDDYVENILNKRKLKR